MNITKNEIKAVLKIVKSPEIFYNANNLAKQLDITPMGSLKVLKRLEQEGVLRSKQIGKAKIYRINLENNYARKYVGLALNREIIHSSNVIKRWVNEIKKVKNADIAILFGSILKVEEPQDIDVLFITDQKRFIKLKKEVRELNKLNLKKIHPMYQSVEDMIENIQKRDKPLLNAIKGVMVFGEDKFLDIYNESRKE
jgi:DNA-binding MarR family transcriptional regulator